MPRLGVYYHRRHIGGKNKLGIVSPVEKEKELMFGMVPYNSFQCLISKPTYTFQLSF